MTGAIVVFSDLFLGGGFLLRIYGKGVVISCLRLVPCDLFFTFGDLKLAIALHRLRTLVSRDCVFY